MNNKNRYFLKISLVAVGFIAGLLFLPNQAQAYTISYAGATVSANSLDVDVQWNALGCGDLTRPSFALNGTKIQYDYNCQTSPTPYNKTTVTLKPGENIFQFNSNEGQTDSCGCFIGLYCSTGYIVHDGISAGIYFHDIFYDFYKRVYGDSVLSYLTPNIVTDQNWEGLNSGAWRKNGVFVLPSSGYCFSCKLSEDRRYCISVQKLYPYLQNPTCGDCCETNVRKVVYVDSSYVIDPSSVTKNINETQQFTGWYDPDGPLNPEARQDKTASATWTTSSSTIATINNSALATCKSAGSATISSTYSVFTATARLTCLDPNQPPTANIKANGSDVPITITYNTSATISWTSTNAASCSVSPTNWTGTSGAKSTGKLISSQTYTLACTGPGGSASDSVTINVTGPSYVIDPSSISKYINEIQQFIGWYDPDNPSGPQPSQDVTSSATWSINRALGQVETHATITSSGLATCVSVGPSTIQSTYNSLTANAMLTCLALNPPGSFSLSLGGAATCNSVSLSWTSASRADGYRILKGSARVDISPYQPYTALNFIDTSVSPNTTYTYQIEAYNAYGTTRSNSFNVRTPNCAPTISFSANPTSVYQGQSTTLSWTSTSATSCTASGSWSGSKALSGSEAVIPSTPPSATYNLTCSGPGGSTSASVTVNIASLFLPNWKEIIPR